MPSAAVLVNRGSGAGGEGRVEEVQLALARQGVRAEVEESDGANLATKGSQAIQEGAKVLVAAGGDGTVSTLAGVVVGTNAALGVLPFGTMNHFARDTGVPTDLDDAMAAIGRGESSRVDVATANGRVFVNNVSIGLYPAAVRERKDLQAGGTSKRVAKVRAAGTVLRQVPAHDLRLSIDGRSALRTTSFLVVANNPYDLSLGALGSRPALDGGVLGVYTMRRPGRRAVLGLAAQALVGRLAQARDFEGRTAREVTVDAPGADVRAGIDGELARLRTPLRFATHPGGLRLVGAGRVR